MAVIEHCDCAYASALREQNRKHVAWQGELQAEIERLRAASEEAIRLLEALPRRPSARLLLDVRVELRAALGADAEEGMGTVGEWSM